MVDGQLISLVFLRLCVKCVLPMSLISISFAEIIFQAQTANDNGYVLFDDIELSSSGASIVSLIGLFLFVADVTFFF